jgi:hypothetical protein
MDPYFNLDEFLSEVERRAIKEARRIYPENRELANRLAGLVQEVRSVKSAVVREVRESTAA